MSDSTPILSTDPTPMSSLLPFAFSGATVSNAEVEALAAIGRIAAVHPARFDAIAAGAAFANDKNNQASVQSLTLHPNLRTNTGDGGPTGGSSGGGSGGGSSGGTTNNSGVQANLFWWGFQIVLPEAALKQLATASNIEKAASMLVTAALLAVPVQVPLVAAIAAYIALELTLIAAVDKGNGVYISMSWLLPGIFVPTTR